MQASCRHDVHHLSPCPEHEVLLEQHKICLYLRFYMEIEKGTTFSGSSTGQCQLNANSRCGGAHHAFGEEACAGSWGSEGSGSIPECWGVEAALEGQ